MTKEQLEKLEISKIELSHRCYNALYRSGYRVVGDLIGKTPEQLQKIRNIGDKTFNELEETLRSLSFKVNEKGIYDIDMDKLIQENLKDLTDETYMEKLSGILSELVANTREIEMIDKQVLALQQRKVEKESENTNLVNQISIVYKALEENTRNDQAIKEANKTKKYKIK